MSYTIEFLTNKFANFFEQRLGNGASAFSNSLLLFTTTDGVKLIYGSDADALLVKFIGYKRFAIIRPSLKF